MSSSLHVNIEGVRYDCEAVCVIPWIWFGMVHRILKPDIFHKCCHEDEEAVPSKALPHAHPPPHAEGDPLLVPDQPQLPGLRLLQEPLWAEHLCLGPHVGVLHEAPQVGHGECIFGYDIVSNLALLCYP